MSTTSRHHGPVPGSPAVAIRGLGRRFGATVAVDALDLEVRPAELLTILGPSGCGKTTELRLIAGLDRPDVGVIESDDGLTIDGIGSEPGRCLKGGATVRSHVDHRIAMAVAVGALVADEAVGIEDAEAAVVSFPRFFDALAEAGA